MHQAELPDRITAFANAAIAAESRDDIEPIDVADDAYSAIREALARDDGEPREWFFAMRRSIEVAVELGRLPEAVSRLFAVFVDALRQTSTVVPFADRDAWSAAALVAAAYARSERASVPPKQLSRASVCAAALRQLSPDGVGIQIEDFRVGLTPEAFAAACAEIEVRVRNLGGVAVIDAIFRTLRGQDRIFRGLFQYGRKVTSPMGGVPEPQVPWHFLYNLALKHLTSRPAISASNADWQTMVTQATNLAAAMDVQEFNPYAGIGGFSPYLFHNDLTENVTFDELFSFQQWSSETAEVVFCWWLDALKEAGVLAPKADFEDWRKIGRSLLRTAHPDRALLTADIHYTSLSQSMTDTVRLLSYLACPAKQANAEYGTPLDTSKRDAPFFPIFAFGDGQYLLPPRAIAARGLYERMSTLLRDRGGPGHSAKIGEALERLTERILSEAGVPPTFVREKYRRPPSKNMAGDVDLAVVATDQISLLECKMKPLSNAARGAQIAPAIVDFVKAYLAPLTQAFRHEIALRKNGALDFEGGRRLSWESRGFDRWVITMLDHGSLQNTLFRNNMVPVFLSATLKEDVAGGNVEQLADCNKIIRSWREAVTELAELYGFPVGRFLQESQFFTWWLSVDQLALLLPGSTTLAEAMAPIRNVMFGTGNLIGEFAARQRMDERARAEAKTA